MLPIKFVYLVFEYQPKYKYGGFIHDGRYKVRPKVFSNYYDALLYTRSYKHCSFIRRVKLRY